MGAPMNEPAYGDINGLTSSDLTLATTNEGEWEHEYHENETEDYYFTLDVTTHRISSSKTKSSKQKGGRSRNPKGKTDTHEYDEPAERPTSARNEAAKNTVSVTSPDGEISLKPEQRLQILDLHTSSPLVMLDSELYTCQWSTDFGTQLYVAQSGTIDQSLRSGHVLDVIGMSRARLVGRHASVHPRHDKVGPIIGASVENAISIDEHDDDDIDIEADTSDPASTPDDMTDAERFARVQQKAKDPNTKAKASFLERLSTIKHKKGETDTVPFHGVQNYETPSNHDEIRKRALAADAEVSKVSKNSKPRGGKRQKQARPDP